MRAMNTRPHHAVQIEARVQQADGQTTYRLISRDPELTRLTGHLLTWLDWADEVDRDPGELYANNHHQLDMAEAMARELVELLEQRRLARVK